MAGYWPSSFLTRRSINLQKKEPPSWLNKLGQERIHYMAYGEMFCVGHSI